MNYDLSKEENLLNARLDYLKAIAKEVGITISTSQGEEKNLLESYYKKLDLDKNSIAFKILSTDFAQDSKDLEQKIHNFTNLIFPFGFNASQKIATHNAFNYPLSIVQGPPGTGKTQTTLNIIANALMQDKKIAVVSNNNSALTNILDKINRELNDSIKKDGQNIKFNFFCAYLGNKENKQNFIDSQGQNLPDFTKWIKDASQIKKLQNSLNADLLDSALMLENEKSKITSLIESYELEQKHFKNYLESNFQNNEIPQFIQNLTFKNQALQASIFLENDVKFSCFSLFFEKILEIFHIKISLKNALKNLAKNYDKEYLIVLFKNRFYELELQDLYTQKEHIKQKLSTCNLQEMMREYTNKSLQIFKAKLALKYKNQKRKIYEMQDLKDKDRCQEFIKDYPVICSTTFSLINSLHSDILYDLIVIDEASQVDIATAILALSKAKQAIIIGDLNQLSHIVESSKKQKTKAIYTKYKDIANLDSIFSYKDYNILSFVANGFAKAPNTLLKEHYRCAPNIINFCNQMFYKNELIILTNSKDSDFPISIYKINPGNHADNKNLINQREIDVIKTDIIKNLNENEVGIISPYRNQTNALQEAFSNTGIEANTVDKFQGQEKNIIILSSVDNEISDFTNDARRLNVAISRAKNKLIVVVNGNGKYAYNFNELIKYAKYHKCEIKEAKVYSIFDNLYKANEAQRIKLLKKYKKISSFDSENLMNITLQKVLKDYPFLSVIAHLRLKNLFKNLDLLNEREREFVQGGLSHNDFMIYSNVTKSPFLAIEVDGYAFHQLNPKQQERDVIKDTIFAKYEIPLLRFSTKGSNEEQILREKITSLLRPRENLKCV